MLRENYALYNWRGHIRPRFRLSSHESNWVEHEVFGKKLTQATARWLGKRNGKPTKHASAAATEARRAKKQIEEARREDPPMIYYCYDGQNRVKIGISRRVRRRMQDFAIYGNAILLATEPGTAELEHERHVHFQAEHLGGEWFKTSKRLMEWIRQIRATYGENADAVYSSIT